MRSATFEAASVRHEHEWRVWQNSEIPEQKILIPGVEINLFRPAGSRTVRAPAPRPSQQVQLGDDLVRPAAAGGKIACFRGRAVVDCGLSKAAAARQFSTTAKAVATFLAGRRRWFARSLVTLSFIAKPNNAGRLRGGRGFAPTAPPR